MANDNSANSNVIYPLRRVGLIDDDNKPTSLANEWRIDEKYKAVCDIIIKSVYPTELLELFPDSNVDRVPAITWFMSQGVGQGAADKMVALFSLLKSGEIKDGKPIGPKNNTKQSSSKPKKAAANKSTTAPTADQHTVDNENIPSSTNHPDLHIDLQIHISPDSTPEQIDAIFASMAKHLYGAGQQ